MIDLKIEQLVSIGQIKTALLPLITEKEYDFGWLKPIVEVSLDDLVIAYLNKFPPVTTAYIVLDLTEHMKEATNLLNSCTSLRSEMFDLESRALSSAIEYNQLIKTLEADKLLAHLNLSALLIQSGQKESSEYSNAVQGKFDAALFSLAAKFSQHNQNGNALNYGERISFLRELYCDNIKNIYERMIAIKRTLYYSFNQLSAGIPNYIEVSNSLEGLVRWMRDTIYKFEIKSQYDSVVVKTISFANIAVKKGLKLDEQFKLLADQGFCDIEITPDDLGIDSKRLRTRILAMSMNVIGSYDIVEPNGSAAVKQATTTAVKANNEMKREGQLFYCHIKVPKQDIGLDNDAIFSMTAEEEEKLKEWLLKVQKDPKLLLPPQILVSKDKDGKDLKLVNKPLPEDKEFIVFPNELVFGELQPIYKSSVNVNQNFRSDNSVKNCSPFGVWQVYIKNVTSVRIDADSHRLDDEIWGIKDIALTFRLSLRDHNYNL